NPRRRSRLGTRHAALPHAAAADWQVDGWAGEQQTATGGQSPLSTVHPSTCLSVHCGLLPRLRVPQPVGLELSPCRLTRDAEDAGRGALVVLSQTERELERFSLDVAQTLALARNANVAEAHRAMERAGARTLLVDHQMLGTDHRAVRRQRCAVDNVLQL